MRVASATRWAIARSTPRGGAGGGSNWALMAPVLAQRAQLDGGVQAGEQAVDAEGLPAQREPGHGGQVDRRAELQDDPAPVPGLGGAADPDPGGQGSSR